jgi:membrane peptidoglycan carboxypeptidase
LRRWKPLVWIAAAAAALASAWLAWEAHRLPGAGQLRDELFARRDPSALGTWMPLWAMAGTLQASVLAWEDPAFYHHGALNYPEILRAAWIDLRAGRFERGASTITQQVVKNQFLGPEKTLRRKLREAILAHRLEQALSKDEILTVDLNIADWGQGTVGAEAASRRYFGKAAAQLDWSEAALLAGILPNPSVTNPCSDPARAREARHAVLAKLLGLGQLSQEDFQVADARPVGTCAGPSPGRVVMTLEGTQRRTFLSTRPELRVSFRRATPGSVG